MEWCWFWVFAMFPLLVFSILASASIFLRQSTEVAHIHNTVPACVSAGGVDAQIV